jgi:hypothetical protein
VTQRNQTKSILFIARVNIFDCRRNFAVDLIGIWCKIYHHYYCYYYEFMMYSLDNVIDWKNSENLFEYRRWFIRSNIIYTFSCVILIWYDMIGCLDNLMIWNGFYLLVKILELFVECFMNFRFERLDSPKHSNRQFTVLFYSPKCLKRWQNNFGQIEFSTIDQSSENLVKFVFFFN